MLEKIAQKAYMDEFNKLDSIYSKSKEEFNDIYNKTHAKIDFMGLSEKDKMIAKALGMS